MKTSGLCRVCASQVPFQTRGGRMNVPSVDKRTRATFVLQGSKYRHFLSEKYMRHSSQRTGSLIEVPGIKISEQVGSVTIARYFV